MIETTNNANIVNLAVECADKAGAIQYNMLQLNAISYAVSQLTTYMNELDREGLNGMGQLIIGQIDSQVRMIDMAMNSMVDSMNTDTQILVESAEKTCKSVAAIFE